VDADHPVAESVSMSGTLWLLVLKYWPTATHELVEVQAMETRIANGVDVLASDGTGAWSAVQLPFEYVSITGWVPPVVVMYEPTANCTVRDGAALAWQGTRRPMPQFWDPSHRPWLEPDPALLGWGAWTSVHVVPFCISMRPHGWPAVSLYQPTVVQEFSEAQAADAWYTSGLVEPLPASEGSGASVVVQPCAGGAAEAAVSGTTRNPRPASSTTNPDSPARKGCLARP
jgi:hypothetical protein